MTVQHKRCPYRYYNHLINNTATNWDNRCKLEEGHTGEHVERGMIFPTFTQTQSNVFQSGWIDSDKWLQGEHNMHNLDWNQKMDNEKRFMCQ